MVTEAPAEILIQRLQEYGKLWQKYIELFNSGLETESPTPESEKEFRDLQVELTRRAQFLVYAIPDNIFNKWKDVKKLISETPSLEILRKEVPIRISAFRHLWHDVSIAMNQKQGQLRTVLEQRETKTTKRKK